MSLGRFPIQAIAIRRRSACRQKRGVPPPRHPGVAGRRRVHANDDTRVRAGAVSTILRSRTGTATIRGPNFP